LRIGVLSDTHQNVRLARDALQLISPLDFFLHLGDYVEDARVLSRVTGIPCRFVKGNGDIAQRGPRELSFTLWGIRIWAIHGDQFDEGGTIDEEILLLEARKIRAQVVLFGHSHVQVCRVTEGIHLLNPGHMMISSEHGTLGVLTLSPQGGIKAELLQFPNTYRYRPPGPL
jgi:putative phosphoesterase